MLQWQFEPNVDVLLDVIGRRRIPTRIPAFEAYCNPLVAERVIGRPFPPEPYDTPERCRAYLTALIEYQLALRQDIICLELKGQPLPWNRQTKGDYQTGHIVPQITNREDYNKYPWPTRDTPPLADQDRLLLETAAAMLPPGMGILASHCGIYEVMNYICGYEPFGYLMSDDPELADEMADRIGHLNERVFTALAQYECVNILHMGDDIAYKSGTFVAPALLRKWLFPWMKKYAAIAHQHGKYFTYHSDGNFKPVAADIVAAGVDGKQAFEDLCYPATEFKRDWGNQIAILGGIDVGKLARLPEPDLRRHVREVLAICAVDGGFAVGSGNCFATSIPLSNYLAMLDEADRFSGKA